MKTLSNIAVITAVLLLGVVLLCPDIVDDATDRVLGAFDTAPDAPSLIPSPVLSYLDSVKLAPSIGNTRSNELSDITAAAIVDATNQERIDIGLEPLRTNDALIHSATIKAQDMLTNQYFEHTSPSGVGIRGLANTVDYGYVLVGENLAYGDFTSGKDVVNEWMKSPGHRANILRKDYQEIGVAVVRGTYQGREVWFAVQHFGTPRNVCPVIDSALKASVDSIDTDLKSRQAQIATEKAFLEAPDHPQGQAYRDRVTAFNNLVSEYNTALVISQEKIKDYNAQAAAFNACIMKYQ